MPRKNKTYINHCKCGNTFESKQSLDYGNQLCDDCIVHLYLGDITQRYDSENKECIGSGMYDADDVAEGLRKAQSYTRIQKLLYCIRCKFLFWIDINKPGICPLCHSRRYVERRL